MFPRLEELTQQQIKNFNITIVKNPEDPCNFCDRKIQTGLECNDSKNPYCSMDCYYSALIKDKN
jgi:hypothetical protein